MRSLRPLGGGSLRCSVLRPRRESTARTGVRSIQTSATSQRTKRAARGRDGPCASASHRRLPATRPRPGAANVVRDGNDPSCRALPDAANTTAISGRGWREANPGSKGGARSVKTGRGTWTDSLPRRPRLAPTQRNPTAAMRHKPAPTFPGPFEREPDPHSRQSQFRATVAQKGARDVTEVLVTMQHHRQAAARRRQPRAQHAQPPLAGRTIAQRVA